MPLSRVNLGPLGLQPGQRDPLEDLLKAHHPMSSGIHGIDVHPYVNFNSFPRHGSARESYGWSLAFLRPPVTAPLRPDHIGMRISVAGFNTEDEIRHLVSSIQDGVKIGG